MSFNYLSRELTLTRLPNGMRRTEERVVYDNKLVRVDVPKGTTTDLASVPWYLRWFVSNEDPRIVRPSVVHDYLYEMKEVQAYIDGKRKQVQVTKRESDLLFYEMLRKEGFGVVMAKAIWLGPKVGGRKRWKGK